MPFCLGKLSEKSTAESSQKSPAMMRSSSACSSGENEGMREEAKLIVDDGGAIRLSPPIGRGGKRAAHDAVSWMHIDASATCSIKKVAIPVCDLWSSVVCRCRVCRLLVAVVVCLACVVWRTKQQSTVHHLLVHDPWDPRFTTHDPATTPRLDPRPTMTHDPRPHTPTRPTTHDPLGGVLLFIRLTYLIQNWELGIGFWVPVPGLIFQSRKY